MILFYRLQLSIILFIYKFSGFLCSDNYVQPTLESNDGKKLEQFLQPNDVDSGLYDSIFEQNNIVPMTVNVEENICVRECDDIPRSCYYKFVVEHYSAMGYSCGNCSCRQYYGCSNLAGCEEHFCISADGYPRNIITVNKRFPGPPIQVCKGDRVIVDVTNALVGISTTLHWHGQFQKDSPWMDGVSMISQCPILPGNTFRYNFIASEAGTHFWHDHTGLIKLDGVQGPLIVREPTDEAPNSVFYDHDLPSHTIFVSDWQHSMTADQFPDMKTLPYGKQIETLLINGRGSYEMPPRSHYSRNPLATFRVFRGNSYRFRVIGAMSMMCAVELLIENHDFLVIAVDGNSIRPTAVSSVVLTSGERVDIVVNALRNIDVYWIYVRGISPCHTTTQVGLLQYEGSGIKNYYVSPSPLLRTINHPNFTLPQPTNYLISDLRSRRNAPIHIRQPSSTTRFTFLVSQHRYTRQEFNEEPNQLFIRPFEKEPPIRLTINGISSSAPSAPLYTQYNDVPKDQFCSAECMNGTNQQPCPPCVHLVKIPLNRTVDFIIADTANYTGFVHPFHLHGHKFYVLEQGRIDGNLTMKHLVDRLDAGLIRIIRPPVKDTLAVPTGTYALIRFFTDNPGIWLFHCHFILHNIAGMRVFLQVGEFQDFPKPPINWPTCGNYLPPI